MEQKKTIKRNQHYVPQFLLRNFSLNDNNKQIGIYNITKDVYVKETSIKNQAKEDFFYGNDGEVEDALAALESVTAPIVRDIIASLKLPSRLSKASIELLTFMIFQSVRTKKSESEVNEMTNLLSQLALQHHDKYKDKGITVRYENAATVALAAVASKIEYGYDLKMKLLINNTITPFVLSDTPVVRYNQFLEHRKHPGGHYGLVSKGLQLFMPISPRHLLLLYDDVTYKVGVKHSDIITIVDEKDVFNLNLLQFLTCYENVFFNHLDVNHLSALTKKVDQYKQHERLTMDVVNEHLDEKGFKHTIYHGMKSNYLLKLNFSFSKFTKIARKHKMNDFAVQFRREKYRYSFQR